MTGALGRWALAAGAGAVGGGLAGLVAAAQLVLGARRFFVTSRELGSAVRSLLSIHVAAGAIVGLLIGGLAWGAVALGRRVAADDMRGAGRVLGVLVAPVVGFTLWALTQGPQARRIPGRAAIVVLLALVAAAVLAFALPRVAALVDRSSRTVRIATAAVLVAIGAGLVVADTQVLSRLYPLFHAWVGTLALVAMLAAVWLAVRGTRLARLPWALVPLGIAIASVAVGGAALGSLLATQNARAVLSERAPAVGRALQVLAWAGMRPPSAVERIVELTPELEAELAPRPTDISGLPSLDVSDRDLLLVTIDALRADHLGAYGYRRPTSPRIDALAKGAVVFEHAYTATPQTSYAVASLLTGKYVRSLFRLDQPPSNETIAHMLRARGMHTAAFFTDAVFFIDRERFRAFEDDRFGFEYNKMHPVDARPRLEQVREYLDTRPAGERVFVWVHFFEPHEPYVPHPGHVFGDRDVDRYDGEIAETDAAVGDLLEMMNARGRAPIVVVTADHGEEFGDHGGRYHGSTLYDEQVAVPLIMRVPGISPRRVATPVQTVDIVPTILGLYGVPYGARVRGTDLRPLLFGRPLDTRVFAEGIRARMLIVGDHKLICDEEQDLCQLYDLRADVAERHNLADAQPDRVSTLRRTLNAWAASHARFERAADAQVGAGDWPEAIRRVQLGDEGARTDAITLLATSPDAHIRAKAAEVLGPLGGEGVVTALERALEDREPSVAATAALSLLEMGDEHGAATVRRLSVDAAAPAPLRHRAILALGSRGDPAAAPLLRGLVADHAVPAETRSAAIAELGRLRDRRAVPLLLAQMDDVRQKLPVVHALTAIGDRRAVSCLERAVVSDPYDTVRSAAAAGLATLGQRSSCRALKLSLAGREPVVGALEALVGLGCVPDLRQRPVDALRCDERGCAPSPGGATVPGARGRGASRVVAWWTAEGDGGRLVLGGQAIDLVSGAHEGDVDLPPGTREVSIALDPPDLRVRLRALIVLPVQ